MMVLKRRWVSQFVQGLMVVVLIVNVTFNVIFILDNSERFQRSIADYTTKEASEDENINAPDGLEDSENATIKIEASSSKNVVRVTVNEDRVYENTHEDARGIHVIVLSEKTGHVMAKRIFDTYLPKEDESLINFVSSLQDNRVVVFSVKDEASSSLKEIAKAKIQGYGSLHIDKLSWRDSWVFIFQKPERWLAESYQASEAIDTWGDPVAVQIVFRLDLKEHNCKWNKDGDRRKEFCSKFEGYGAVCSCMDPLPIDLYSPPIPNNRIANIPIAVIAANRPHYLYRMLRGLLITPGVNRHTVTIYIDGFFDEPVAIAKLLQHYKRTLQETFRKYPQADFMLILEEDLDVSRDIIDYFSQLAPVLLSDESIYCVSAWNDQGYEHSCKDPSLLYRVETMPGLGWLLKRKLFKEELEAKWPGSNAYWDWDMWMRDESNIRGRECIIPDVSRTYHFGAKGLNMNSYMQELYFTKHALNTKTGINFDVDKVTKSGYERDLRKLIETAQVVDHTRNPCLHNDFIPDTHGHTYAIYIRQKHLKDYQTWISIAKCFKLWDLDVRGFHKSMWRFWLKENAIFVIGTQSPYVIYKPRDVTPLFISQKDKQSY